jgi:hypothetical protein
MKEEMMRSILVAWLLSICLIGLWGGPVLGQNSEMDAPAVTIAEAVVCREVVDRTPVGAGDVFPRDTERLYCFVRVVGANTDIEIQHRWYYQGQLVATVTLPIRSENWRTYSSKRIGPEMTGEWTVEIGTTQGETLKKIIFVIE